MKFVQWYPCAKWPEIRLNEFLGAGRTIEDLAEDNRLSLEDFVWSTCRAEIIGLRGMLTLGLFNARAVLGQFESLHPNDKRVREAIRAAWHVRAYNVSSGQDVLAASRSSNEAAVFYEHAARAAFAAADIAYAAYHVNAGHETDEEMMANVAHSVRNSMASNYKSMDTIRKVIVRLHLEK